MLRQELCYYHTDDTGGYLDYDPELTTLVTAAMATDTGPEGDKMKKKEKRTQVESILDRIPPYLKKQILITIDGQYAKVNDRRKLRQPKTGIEVGERKTNGEALLDSYHEWVKAFVFDFFATRNARAEELSSPEVEKAREIARKYIGEGNHDFFCTCMDGRNLPVIMFSKVPHVGGVLRTPAGKLDGFSVNSVTGDIDIDRNSLVVQQIENLLTNPDRNGQRIYYGLDSHFGCAARKKSYDQYGAAYADKGLYSDIQEKYEVARGLLKLRAELIAEGKQCAEIIPTFFSYQSATGYVTMGLEANLGDSLANEYGFTFPDSHDKQKPPVIVTDELAKDGKIVRAEDLIREPVILEALQSVAEFVTPKSADFRGNYGKSLLNNWKAIEQIYQDGEGKAYQFILDKLQQAYIKSGWAVGGDTDDLIKQTISDRTIRQKAKFMLKNVVTRYAVGGTDEHWPFDIHKEVIGVITDGGYGPFPTTDEGEEVDAFSIFSKDHSALYDTSRLVIDLIRGSRDNGSAKNAHPQVLEGDNYKNGPVVIVNKAILRIEDETTWELLSQLNLHALTQDIAWNKTNNFSRENVLAKLKKIVPEVMSKVTAENWVRFVDAVLEILQRMAILSQEDLYKMMVDGKLVVMNTLLDKDRKPRIVLPIIV